MPRSAGYALIFFAVLIVATAVTLTYAMATRDQPVMVTTDGCPTAQ